MLPKFWPMFCQCFGQCFCQSANLFWRPSNDDVLQYPDEDILCVIEPPSPNGSFYRDEPILMFSGETLAKILAAYQRCS